MKTMKIMKITAPYNFVPLSRWVFEPEWANPKWANSVSHDIPFHDIPFKDGLCGQLELKIASDTPLMIGKDLTKPVKGEVHCLKIGDKYAIAGSSLKGMIRNVLEIATFGKMSYVDDRRMAIRDISGSRVKEDYMAKIDPTKTRAGFLKLTANANEPAEITPCEFVHISHRDMESYLKNKKPYVFTKKETLTIKKKYDKWDKELKELPELESAKSKRDLPLIKFDKPVKFDGRESPVKLATHLGSGKEIGELVFTGQVSDKGQNEGGKYRDFVFYDEKPDKTLSITSEQFRDFLFIHGEDEVRDSKKNSDREGRADNLPWAYWREKLFKNKEIPIFYHEDSNGKVKSMGLAYMYRLIYDNSIGELIENANSAHRNEQVTDLPELLFGRIRTSTSESEDKQSLKSRISFSTMTAQGNPEPTQKPKVTILNAPKPSYFPNYIVQTKTRLSETDTYNTYMNLSGSKKPVIRGWKRYPVRKQAQVQGLTEEQAENQKLQVKLHTLPEKTTFTGKVRFHNLRPFELGALLWSLTWGNDSQLRHSLGMGKSFGFGQIHIEITKDDIRPNDKKNAVKTVSEYIEDFCKQMDEYYKEAQQDSNRLMSWQVSEQIIQLLAMANPDHLNATPDFDFLKHMQLSTRPPVNEFNKAKQQGLALPEYESYNGTRDKDITWLSTVEIKQRRAEKHAQAERDKAEAARKASLSPFEQRIEGILEKRPTEKNYVVLLDALEKEDWTEAEKIQVAEKIKGWMQAQTAKVWKETSNAKRPEKDADYQRTLRVLRFLKK